VARIWVRSLTAPAALLAALLPFAAAGAQTSAAQTIPIGASPVIRLQLRSGDVTIRTWDRPQVQIASTQAVQAQHFDPAEVSRALHGNDIPIFAARIFTPRGQLLLPQEDFAVPNLTGSPHDGVRIAAPDGASVTVTVPNSTALIWVAVGRGTLRIQDYRSGAFIARVHNGAIDLSNVGGDAYVEAARGRIAIAGSAFDRIRTRTAIGNTLFENCNSRQIEASSIAGNIVYDNGTFVPGLARFETVDGNIALGVAGGGASIAAHSSAGHIYSGLERGARVDGSGGDVQAVVGGGGPVVTASSQHGSVYLYSGTLRKQPQLEHQWRVFRARTSVRRPYRV
jgi:hypothetical protein